MSSSLGKAKTEKKISRTGEFWVAEEGG